MILHIKISNEGKLRKWQEECPYIQGIDAICRIVLGQNLFSYGKKTKVNDDWVKISICNRKKIKPWIFDKDLTIILNIVVRFKNPVQLLIQKRNREYITKYK